VLFNTYLILDDDRFRLRNIFLRSAPEYYLILETGRDIKQGNQRCASIVGMVAISLQVTIGLQVYSLCCCVVLNPNTAIPVEIAED